MLLVVDGVKIYSEQITCHSLKTDGVNHLALTKKNYHMIMIQSAPVRCGKKYGKFYKQSVLHMLTLWVIIHHCVVCSSSIYGF
jgi:hypothetical protein